MEKDVTIVPVDNVILVNGIHLQLDFKPIEGHEQVHAIQWHDGKGAIEFSDYTGRDADYETDVAPYVALWEAEKARLDAEAAAKKAEYNRLENVVARKLDELNAKLEETKTSSAAHITSSTGYVVNANTTAKQNIDGLITAMTAQNLSTVNFMTFDNTLAELTLEQLKTLQLELISYGNNLYAKKWSLRAQIEACTTKEEVDAIVIDYSDVTA
uniref:DUF4376 domain-containing protein n=1 Tax=Myoviridae sp. ctrnx29 TaxID=2826704 RepID=A0A8S5LXU0_9CAUD|nr:MAG TPA: protein of unknown function (DUF4376) [Myoviridae sp. ctrnx29]